MGSLVNDSLLNRDTLTWGAAIVLIVFLLLSVFAEKNWRGRQ